MAALDGAAQKRGPRIGDAASLWNFTPAPGWTKDEAQILKLCLMKHGVGRWVQILETGLLPGKMIQQLNGQTQRLLGQQSLAAYTGLQVDIDRIRADNDLLAHAERKNGLVINSGPNLTKQQKQQMQEEAKAKYGLSQAELQDVEEQLAELAALRPAAGGAAAAAAAGGFAALPEAGAARGRAQQDAELLARDTSSMSQQQRINFLLHLREKLQQAAARLARAQQQRQQPGGAQQEQPHAQQQQHAQPPQPQAGAAAAAAAWPAPMEVGDVEPPPLAVVPVLPARSAENHGAVANAVPMQLDVPAAAAAVGMSHAAPAAAALAAGKPAAAGRAGGAKRKPSGGARQRRAASFSEDDSSDGDWAPEPRVPSSRRGGGGGGGASRAALAAATEADVAQLMGMGFSAKQARDALEEAGGDVEAAIEWLVASIA